MAKKSPKISCCMMVKNEEELLEDCLKSIKPLVHELIIIDTGSKDGTKKIAGKYTDKIFDSPWKDDFSFHRNESIKKASGDWIITIDADERIKCPLNKYELSKKLAGVPKHVNACFISLNDVDSSGTTINRLQQVRIFRAGKARFEGVVHNLLVIDGKQEAMPQNYLGIEYIHLGYDLSPEKMKTKHERTIGLLEKRIKKDKDDYDAMFYLAQSYCASGEYGKGVETAKKTLEMIPENNENMALYGGLYYLIGSKLFQMAKGKDEKEQIKLIQEAVNWFTAGLELFPDDLDLNYGMFYFGMISDNATVCRRNGLLYLLTRNKLRRNSDYLGNRFMLTSGDQFEKIVISTLDNIKKGVNPWH